MRLKRCLTLININISISKDNLNQIRNSKNFRIIRTFNKVFISIKPRNGDFVPNLIKQNIKRDLKKYSVAGIVPEILDLKYLFIETDSKVYYNTNLAPSASFVGSKVKL